MKILMVLATVGWVASSATACSTTDRRIEGFDYRCFDRCHENRRTDRDCVQQCTDEQSVKGQSQ